MKRPGYLKDAVATPLGYRSPKGELLKRINLTESQIEEWNKDKDIPLNSVLNISNDQYFESLEKEEEEKLSLLQKLLRMIRNFLCRFSTN